MIISSLEYHVEWRQQGSMSLHWKKVFSAFHLSSRGQAQSQSQATMKLHRFFLFICTFTNMLLSLSLSLSERDLLLILMFAFVFLSDSCENSDIMCDVLVINSTFQLYLLLTTLWANLCFAKGEVYFPSQLFSVGLLASKLWC